MELTHVLYGPAMRLLQRSVPGSRTNQSAALAQPWQLSKIPGDAIVPLKACTNQIGAELSSSKADDEGHRFQACDVQVARGAGAFL
jgi:hypothetical protein